MMNRKAQIGWIVLIVFGIMLVGLIWSLASGYISLGANTISAQNFQQNYQWFKSQESAMLQLKSQICASVQQVNDFKNTFGNDTSKWSSDATRQYGDLTFAQNGYVSKYNSLVSDYNAHRNDFIRNFGRSQAPPTEYAEFYQAQCN
jgi:hypothetical protein